MKGKTLIDAIRNNVESAGTQDPDFNISKALDDDTFRKPCIERVPTPSAVGLLSVRLVGSSS